MKNQICKQEESDDEVIQQPIPFQMGVTPTPEEGVVPEELRTWYEETEETIPQARGSTDPIPEKVSRPKPKPIVRERSPRNLRNQTGCSFYTRTNQRQRFIGIFKHKAETYWTRYGTRTNEDGMGSSRT